MFCDLNCVHILCLQGTGDSRLAYRCFKLSLTYDNNHSESFNNLGVLEWHRERGEQVSNGITG